MDIEKYFERIHFNETFSPTREALFRIHECHVLKVPFENLDIHFKKELSLTTADLFNKVVNNKRGGFCYELNYLLYELLTRLGYSCTIIEARISDVAGNPGPAFDHMALIATVEKPWLLDVGYGDLFIQPLELTENKIQSDGRNYFRIERYAGHDYMLLMSSDKINYEKRYTFNTMERSVSDFVKQCADKQVNPDSYFVKNTVCTLPTSTGRVTIFNDKLTEKKDSERREEHITDEAHLKMLLRKHFDIELS